MVHVHVGLADWSKSDLYDIDLGIAAKYKLSGCQQRDRRAARQYAEDFRKRKSNSANHCKGPLNKFFTESNTERYIPNPLLGFEMPNPPEMVLEYVAPIKTKKKLKSTSLKDKSQVMQNVISSSKDRNPKQHKQCHITKGLTVGV